MVSVPQEAPVSVRVAAIQRRLTACHASIKVLRCGQQEFAAASLQREIAELEAELAELRIPAARPA